MAAQTAQQPKCLTCFRTFGSKMALRDHKRSLPAHKDPSSANAPTEPERSKPKRTRQKKSFYTFPDLHPAVIQAVADVLKPPPRFNPDVAGPGQKSIYSTNVTGKFRCMTKKCRTDGWSSKVVSIVVRGYHNNSYNAVVYNQRCRACENLGALEVDTEPYVQRVAYRLKKWAGIVMESPYYDPKRGPPHDITLCEGCKQGYCRQRRVEYD